MKKKISGKIEREIELNRDRKSDGVIIIGTSHSILQERKDQKKWVVGTGWSVESDFQCSNVPMEETIQLKEENKKIIQGGEFLIKKEWN